MVCQLGREEPAQMSNSLSREMVELEHHRIVLTAIGTRMGLEVLDEVRGPLRRSRLCLTPRLVDVPLLDSRGNAPCRTPIGTVDRGCRADPALAGAIVNSTSGLSSPHRPHLRSECPIIRTHVRAKCRTELDVDSPPPRGVAQSGSAFGWGPKGRWFKSSRPDFSLESSLPPKPPAPASPRPAEG